MKSYSLTSILQGALVFSLLLSVIFFFQFYFKTRDARLIQTQLVQFQQRRAVLTQLLSETLEYSKRNPDIDRILIPAGFKPGPASGKPAAK